MKQFYLILSLFFSLSVSAQIPNGYYDSATGSGLTLKTNLKRIINNVNDGLATEFIATDNGYAALYTTFQNSDIDLYYENNGTLLDMYSERVTQNPDNTSTNLPDVYEYTYGINQDDGTMGTAEGQRYNREHIVPQSTFSSDSPMRNDAHFVVPSDKYVNAQRGNFPYGIVPTATQDNIYSNGSKRGANSNSGVAAGYVGTVFEPIDEFKGDIARMYFYFATRYEDQMTSFNYTMFDGSANVAIAQPFLDILYYWHVEDPVSQREIDRNNAIYDQQSNRNPYIDNPSFVFEIWQNSLSVEEFDLTNKINMYPNPVADNSLHITSVKDLDIKIYNLLGKLVLEKSITPTNDEINISNLKSGVYLVKMNSDNHTVTKKLIRQ
jgi:endonuclease I